MRFALLALLLVAGLSFGQCPPGGCPAPAKAPALTWSPQLGAWVQMMPARVEFVAASPPRLYVPLTAVPVYAVAPPPKRFPTPIRDFFFGR